MTIRDTFNTFEQAYAALKAEIDAAYPPVQEQPNNAVVFVPAGGDLQKAIDEARPGTTIMLDPGATYNRITLPLKESDAPILIRPKLDLPAGRLNTKALQFPLPRILNATAAEAIRTHAKAHHFTLQGVEIDIPAGLTAVSVGTSLETALDDLPNFITFDRVWIHTNPTLGGHRGIAANGRTTVVRGSVIEGFWQSGRDSQSICGWAGPGPFTIEDCYLEASGENFMLGGAAARIPGVAPGGLTFRYNTCFKPQEWRTKKGSVKNLFELKNCRGALIEFNTFDGSWTDAQAGAGVLFTVRNQGGSRRDTIVENVMFRHNIIRNVEYFGINMLGWDDEYPTDVQGNNMEIMNNLILSNQGIMINRGWDGLTIAHNTMPNVRTRFLQFTTQKNADGTIVAAQTTKKFVYRDNVTASGSYGIAGDGMTNGTPTLDYYAPGYDFRRNVIEKTAARKIAYPTDNILLEPTTLAGQLDADGSIKIGSLADVPSSDGSSMGCNVAMLSAAGVK